MEYKNRALTEALNDLIKINNDRIESYESASSQEHGGIDDIRSLFQEMANESKEFNNVLTKKMEDLGDTPANGSSVAGKIYRAWVSLKTTLASNDRDILLGSSAYTEEATQKAYKDVLSSDIEMSSETRQMIISQQEHLLQSMQKISELRKSETLLEFAGS